MNDYLNRTGRPAAQSANRVVNDQQPVGPGQVPPTPKKSKLQNNGLNKIIAFVVAIVVVVLIAAAVYFFVVRDSTTSQIQSNKYQAVFLNSADGQVYFGKLSVMNNRYYKLTDIYYVRVEQVQPDKTNTQPKQNISLAKLGSEIHGPQDTMYINRDSVMFWENLKDDGQVAKAISDYKKNGSSTNNNQQQTTTPTKP